MSGRGIVNGSKGKTEARWKWAGKASEQRAWRVQGHEGSKAIKTLKEPRIDSNTGAWSSGKAASGWMVAGCPSTEGYSNRGIGERDGKLFIALSGASDKVRKGRGNRTGRKSWVRIPPHPFNSIGGLKNVGMC